jgi:hypothetical protein
MFSAHFEAPLCNHLYLMHRCSVRIPLTPVNLSNHSRWLAAVVCVAAQWVPPASDPPQLRVPSCGAPAGAGSGGGGPGGGPRSSQSERLSHREQEPHLRVQVSIHDCRCSRSAAAENLHGEQVRVSSNGLIRPSTPIETLSVLLSTRVYTHLSQMVIAPCISRLGWSCPVILVQSRHEAVTQEGQLQPLTF